MSKQYIKWIIDEYFTSFIDSEYFKLSEMKEFLKRLETFSPKSFQAPYSPTDDFIFFSEEEKARMKSSQTRNASKEDKFNSMRMPCKEWNLIRARLGKPRRFSPAFISEEKQKAEKFREIIRKTIQNQTEPPHLPKCFDPSFSTKIKKTMGLRVSQAVFAIHPVCGHLHFGRVLTVDQNVVVINFLGSDLGVQKIKDIHVTACPSSDNRPNGHLNSIPGSIGSRTNFDFQLIALTLELCSRKSYLLNELRKFNGMGEAYGFNLNERFYFDLKWTVQQIEQIDKTIDMIFKSGNKEGESGEDDDSEGKMEESFFNGHWEKLTNSRFYEFLKKKYHQTKNTERKQEMSMVLNEIYKRLEVTSYSFKHSNSVHL